ncbi:hypothetical protein HUT16_36005 [Kitasatospora sp. NA04385]|uniref:helix-turn-helix domain-containing protein n=1 Tax=Kitasatospora sp. NA04385 TaxID=2742135 RepID=UPI0015902C65|nr:hypothetical protein [Kitasatospora sp. NA04385]QKW23790.1 hypothetical protein HUT16_36005 [Kitasatospora sp. NA04385]
MNDFSAHAMGLVIREHREARQPPMSRAELAWRTECGRGGSLLIERFERGLISPGTYRLAAIALAFGLTPGQLAQEAKERTGLLAEEPGPPPGRLRERIEATERRRREVDERHDQRQKIAEEYAEAFSGASQDAHEAFFRRFVELAAGIGGAAEPEEAGAAGPDGLPAPMRVQAMSDGIAAGIRDVAAGTAATAVGGAVGAAVGGAAAYTAFTAAAAFGTASTGTAITALYGAAATNATLAVLGGGTLATGGAGMAGGVLLLGGIVAAPTVVLAATGLYVFKRHRAKKDERQARAETDAVQAQLDRSQRNFDIAVEASGRAAAVLEHIQVHGAHALERWAASLPPEPRDWESLDPGEQERYREFLTVAASCLAVGTIDVEALLAAEPGELREMERDIDGMLRYADRAVRSVG